MTAVRKAAAPALETARRLVIKVGSALLVDEEKGDIRRAWLDALADDIARLKKRGVEVLLVSSGAIAAGRRHLGLLHKGLKLEEKQAAAATGQIRLAHAWQGALARHEITVAQILLTPDDTEQRRRHLNARSTINQLLKLGAVPVINENDTVATDEIRFGDNDRLAARVAAMVSADLLVLLSTIDGLYTADPHKDPSARKLTEVSELTPEIEAMAGVSNSADARGGMVTKLVAAKLCMNAGCSMIIADGRQNHPLTALERDGACTWFLPRGNPQTARKTWIGGTLQPAGVLIVDEGAAKALGQGRSLLPAGIIDVTGAFQRGDAVTIRRRDGRDVARGLVNYSAEDARRIIGHKTDEIESLLGYRGRDAMVHRDDLVIL